MVEKLQERDDIIGDSQDEDYKEFDDDIGLLSFLKQGKDTFRQEELFAMIENDEQALRERQNSRKTRHQKFRPRIINNRKKFSDEPDQIKSPYGLNKQKI